MSTFKFNNLRSLTSGNTISVDRLIEAEGKVSGLEGNLDLAALYATTLNELKNTDETVLNDGRVAILSEDRRGGVFRWFSSDKSTEVSNDPQQGIWVAPEGGDGSTGAWMRMFDGWEGVAPEWFGAVGDGVNDDTTPIQAAHLKPYDVNYSSSRYLITSEIQVRKGSKAKGVKGLRFPDNETRTIIEQTTSGQFIFVQDESTFSGQEDGFSAYDLFLLSENCIKLNDPLVTITDGAGATSPYLMRSEFRRLTIQSPTIGSGTGIILSKCFDFIIEQCEFYRHARHLVLQGCDIGRVSTNRFTSISEYAILELSCDTFGSQNQIINNDMVGITSPSGRFIRSTSRHVRIYDNYMEQQSGSFAGFIDLSEVGVPTYGSNVPSETRYSSISVKENRLDGWSYSVGFIYRITSGRLLNTIIEDSGTTGVPSTMPWLVDASGNKPFLPVMWSNTNASKYKLRGGRGSDSENSAFKNFETSEIPYHNGVVSFGSESLFSLRRSGLVSNNSWEDVRLSDDGFVLQPSLGTTLFQCTLPARDGISNPYLRSGASYIIKVRARTRSGTETLRCLYLINGASSGAAVDTTVGPQSQTITFTRTGASAGDPVGVAFANQSSSPSSGIVVESVSFEEV